MNDKIKIKIKDPLFPIQKFIRKISVFECTEKLCYRHKLTPSPYNYLSYNHKSIPVSIFPKYKIHHKNRLMIAGIKTEEIFVEYKGPLLQILVEFTASGFYNLFHHSPVLFVNHLIKLNKIISAVESENLETSLNKASNVNDQISILEEFFSSKIENAKDPLEYLEKAIDMLEKKHGVLHISEVAETVGVSERQLDRKFKTIVGISPKKFAKFLQFHYLITLLLSEEYSFQDVAFRGAYYDRPHLNHAFKELTGMTPVQFIRSDNHLAFQYYKNF